MERTFQAGTRWPRARVEQRKVQYLYGDGDAYHFMDSETYDQFAVSAKQIGDDARYLKEGTEVFVSMYEGEVLGVDLPVAVDLRVAAPIPGSPADTATGAQEGRHPRDRPRRPGAALRERGRHAAHRHPDRRVHDPHPVAEGRPNRTGDARDDAPLGAAHLRVSDLNRRVRGLLDGDAALADVWVEGEVSQPILPAIGPLLLHPEGRGTAR